MTEEEARDQVRALTGDKVMEQLERFAAMVLKENGRQNLIAPSTEETIWARHILDSAQLLHLFESEGIWLDVGTGGGFPGLVLAIASQRPLVLVEPRRRRSEFLLAAVEELSLRHTQVRSSKVERVTDVTAEVVSARAVASVEKLVSSAIHCSTWNTRWVLPRGSSVMDDLHRARRVWQGEFHAVPSMTDPTSSIIIASNVALR